MKKEHHNGQCLDFLYKLLKYTLQLKSSKTSSYVGKNGEKFWSETLWIKGRSSSSNMYLIPLDESISLWCNNYCCSLPVSKVVCDDFSLINVKTFKPSILGAVFYSNACQKCLKLLNALNQGEMVFWKNQPTNKHKKKEKGKHI